MPLKWTCVLFECHRYTTVIGIWQMINSSCGNILNIHVMLINFVIRIILFLILISSGMLHRNVLLTPQQK